MHRIVERLDLKETMFRRQMCVSTIDVQPSWVLRFPASDFNNKLIPLPDPKLNACI